MPGILYHLPHTNHPQQPQSRSSTQCHKVENVCHKRQLPKSWDVSAYVLAAYCCQPCLDLLLVLLLRPCHTRANPNPTMDDNVYSDRTPGTPPGTNAVYAQAHINTPCNSAQAKYMQTQCRLSAAALSSPEMHCQLTATGHPCPHSYSKSLLALSAEGDTLAERCCNRGCCCELPDCSASARFWISVASSDGRRM